MSFPPPARGQWLAAPPFPSHRFNRAPNRNTLSAGRRSRGVLAAVLPALKAPFVPPEGCPLTTPGPLSSPAAAASPPGPFLNGPARTRKREAGARCSRRGCLKRDRADYPPHSLPRVLEAGEEALGHSGLAALSMVPTRPRLCPAQPHTEGTPRI